MKIAVIGAGAMGSIYGGHLSLHNEVYLVDNNKNVVDSINKNGLIIQEDNKDIVYHPTAVTDTTELGKMNLVILFVKSLYSKAALETNKHLIGPDTYLLTLQNGAGHEDILAEFVPINRIIIGTTEDNGAVLGLGHVRRGGEGNTNIGMLENDDNGFLDKFKSELDCCGFKGHVYDNIQQLIWNKLFTNVSLSVLTGVLQVPIGFIGTDEYAWNMCCRLIHEAVDVAHALGLEADESKITEGVKVVTVNSPEGITSICADLKAGRMTEVNTISGSVVRAAKKCGVEVPTHEFVVNMVHALENASKTDSKVK